jgi:hypothetical protein
MATWVKNAGMPFPTREEAACEAAKAQTVREEKDRVMAEQQLAWPPVSGA